MTTAGFIPNKFVTFDEFVASREKVDGGYYYRLSGKTIYRQKNHLGEQFGVVISDGCFVTGDLASIEMAAYQNWLYRWFQRQVLVD